MSILPVLTPRSSCSYHTSDISGLARWLAHHGFSSRPIRHALTEHSRWERSRRIVVLYHSGACVVQGVQVAPCLNLLNELVAPVAEEVPLW